MKRGPIIAIAVLVVGFGLFYFFGDDREYVQNAPPKNNTIVAFGDSLVEGVGSNRGGGFVSLLEADMAQEVINLGVAGDTTADGLRRISDVLEYDPGIVIVLFGGNDAMRRTPLEETRANLAAMITRLHENGSVVVLLGVRGGLLGDPYEAMYEELSMEYDTAYVPNILEGILLRPELTFDQIHPNDKGYAMVAERVAPILERILTTERN